MTTFDPLNDMIISIVATTQIQYLMSSSWQNLTNQSNISLLYAIGAGATLIWRLGPACGAVMLKRGGKSPWDTSQVVSLLPNVSEYCRRVIQKNNV